MFHLDPVTVKTAREKAGITIEELSAKAHIALDTLIRFEAGNERLDKRLTQRLANALDIEITSAQSRQSEALEGDADVDNTPEAQDTEAEDTSITDSPATEDSQFPITAVLETNMVKIPKKRGPKPKIRTAEELLELSAPKIPKKRGPKPKVKNLDESTEPVEVKIPQKRGPKPKIRTEEELLELTIIKIPKKRGPKPKVKNLDETTEPVEAKIPKKRGRPPKVRTPEELELLITPKERKKPGPKPKVRTVDELSSANPAEPTLPKKRGGRKKGQLNRKTLEKLALLKAAEGTTDAQTPPSVSGQDVPVQAEPQSSPQSKPMVYRQEKALYERLAHLHSQIGAVYSQLATILSSDAPPMQIPPRVWDRKVIPNAPLPTPTGRSEAIQPKWEPTPPPPRQQSREYQSEQSPREYSPRESVRETRDYSQREPVREVVTDAIPKPAQRVIPKPAPVEPAVVSEIKNYLDTHNIKMRNQNELLEVEKPFIQVALFILDHYSALKTWVNSIRRNIDQLVSMQVLLRDTPANQVAEMVEASTLARDARILPAVEYYQEPVHKILLQLPQHPLTKGFFGGQWLNYAVYAIVAKMAKEKKVDVHGLFRCGIELAGGEQMDLSLLGYVNGKAFWIQTHQRPDYSEQLSKYTDLCTALELPPERALILRPESPASDSASAGEINAAMTLVTGADIRAKLEEMFS